MNIPSGFDAITLYQWLWFKCRCHECTATEFQRIFEDVMKRYKPEFIQIRPYGNIGDRKMDGLLRADSAIFQVYSPDDITQAEVVKKINEDLDGVVNEWGDDVKSWTFVYNVRRGLPPDIYNILIQKQEQYPNVKLEHISNDGLWEIARGLTLQQRAEILGAPIGYEQYFIHLENGNNLHPAEDDEDSWIVLIQDVINPIDIRTVIEALKPSSMFGAPIYLRPQMDSWHEAANYQQKIISELFEKCRDSFPSRFAVYSIAPIPLIVQLGFLITYNVQTRYSKLHLDTQSWIWPSENIETQFEVHGVPTQPFLAECDVVIRISLSEKVGKPETTEVVAESPIEIDISVKNPSLTWLRSLKQVTDFADCFRGVLSEIRQKAPACQHIHLFMAVPAPIALVAGQQINPRMNAPVCLYEYARNKQPRYQYAFTLEEG